MVFYASIIIVLFLTFLYWIEKRNLKAFCLFWYIVFLPTQKLLPEEMIPIPGLRFEMLFGLSFLFFDFIYKPDKGIFEPRFIFKKIKHAILIFSIQLLFLVYEILKSTILNNSSASSEDPDIIVFIIRNLITLFIFLRMAILLQYEYYRRLIILALSIGLTFLGISSFLSPFFETLGLTIGGAYKYNEFLGTRVYRSSGLFRGHPTAFAAFMATGFGFAFALFVNNKERIKKMFFLSVMIGCLIGILNSASRAGIIGMVVIILFYLIVEKQSFSKKSMIFFLIISLGIWVVISFGDYMLARFLTTEEQLSGEENAMSRTATWSAHLFILANNPEIWLIGLWGHVNVNGIILAPHSTPLKYLVYGGVPLFIVFYYSIIFLFKYYFKNRDILSFNIIYPVIGYLVPSLMNDNIDIRYLPIFLALGLFNMNEVKLYMLAKMQFLKNKRAERKEISINQI